MIICIKCSDSFCFGENASKFKIFYYNLNYSSYLESESEDSSDNEPLIKKLKKPPTDEEIKETVKKLLANANLEEVTMKQICKEVSKRYSSSFGGSELSVS